MTRTLKSWLHRLVPILLGAVVLALFACTGGFEFIRLDDHDYTFRCLFVRGGLSGVNIGEAFTNLRHAAIWMPFTYISYMFDISLFGPGMGPHHLVNALVHALNAALLLFLLRRLAPRSALWLCVCAAAFWALHPLRVEPTAWIAGRKELLCGTFTLLGLLAWTRGVAPFRWVPRMLGALCCVCACLSKPTAMCFPFLTGAVEWVLLDRGEVVAQPRRTAWKRGASYLPLLLLAVVTGCIAVYSQTHADGYDVRSLYTASFPLRLGNAVVSLGIYVFQTFVPIGLHIDVPFPKDGIPVFWWIQAVVGFLFAGAMGWFCRRDRRMVLACALFFLAAVGPVLGLFGSFGREARADRFVYLPGLAFSMLIVLVPSSWAGLGQKARRVLCVGAGVWLASIIVCTVLLVPTWRNDYTVFSRALSCDARHARALAHVASEECARLGRFPDAIAHYRASLAREWHDGTAGELAFALATHGFKADGMAHRAEYAKEIRACCKSALRNPKGDRKGLMLEALGVAAYWERKWKEAAIFFRLAVGVSDQTRLNARDDALARLGVCLANGGHPREAEQLFTSLARPGFAREDVRAFAEQALIQLASGGRVVLFF